MNRTRMPFDSTLPVQTGGMAALDDVVHVAQTRELNPPGPGFLQAELPKLGAKVLPSQATFVFTDFGRPAQPMNEATLGSGAKARPAPSLGFPGALRINTGFAAANERIIAALREVYTA